MPTTHFAPSADLPSWAGILGAALAVLSLVLLVVEMRRSARGGVGILVTGVLALLTLLAAVLRPVRIAARESVVGARVVVLADASRSMALKDGAASRREARDAAITALGRAAKDTRLLVLGFGEGAAEPLTLGPDTVESSARETRSDLTAALRELETGSDERPAAIVVVSDGRLDDPPEDAQAAALAALGKTLGTPIHTVATTREPPADASVRHVSAAGAAVAHVPLPLRIEVGCAGGLRCDELTVTARELREDGPPALLASGLAHLKDGKATVDLSVTLERAGSRILEVAISPPSGDTEPNNDRRLLTFNVARERVRVLHIAGRPTNDTRALRQWLKSDASVDVVAFFILRKQTSVTNATEQDLALIKFPVDELFTEHLPSFDAVVLQDFNATEYQLVGHMPAIARYVRAGGGLILVGGPNAFIAGGYAGTPIAEVLPVGLDTAAGAPTADYAPFVPEYTEQGRAAPLLGPIRAVLGDELPRMPGTNMLGDVRGGGVVLWTHPVRKTRSGAPMPVLAIGDQGDGRTIAMGVDGGWLLEFSQLGARTSGRGHGALWDGLLGWLMRDPRFEPAQLELASGCTAGLPTVVRARLLPPAPGAKPENISLDVSRIDKTAPPIHISADRPTSAPAGQAPTAELTLPALPAGGYSARIRVGNGPTTRRDFACEAGGDEWADSRPDPERLRAIAVANKGTFSWATDDLGKIPFPKPTVVSAERHVVPVAPPWAWTLAAALAFGAHWLMRRRGGLV